MTGFMAPPLKAEATFFVLTRMPMAVCPFCETEADWPSDIVVVYTEEPISVVPFNFPIRVSGRLELGVYKDEAMGFVSRVRLVDADFGVGAVPELSAEALRVTFSDADGRPFKVLDSLDFAPAPGRLTAVIGAVGFGQVDAAQCPVRPASARRGPRRCSTATTSRSSAKAAATAGGAIISAWSSRTST